MEKSHCQPSLKEKGGEVVNISSISVAKNLLNLWQNSKTLLALCVQNHLCYCERKTHGQRTEHVSHHNEKKEWEASKQAGRKLCPPSTASIATGIAQKKLWDAGTWVEVWRQLKRPTSATLRNTLSPGAPQRAHLRWNITKLQNEIYKNTKTQKYKIQNTKHKKKY